MRKHVCRKALRGGQLIEAPALRFDPRLQSSFQAAGAVTVGEVLDLQKPGVSGPGLSLPAILPKGGRVGRWCSSCGTGVSRCRPRRACSRSVTRSHRRRRVARDANHIPVVRLRFAAP